MAEKAQKDLLARIADAGEEALSRLASSGSADRVMGVVGSMKEQIDALEQKVEELAKASSSAPARKTSSARKSSASSSPKTSSSSGP